MKRILFVLLSFYIASNIITRAQEISILGLKHLPLDLSASTQPRFDSNNKCCALIKIILTDENATFEGNIVGKINFKTNEYWVYVSPGTKLLKVKIPGCFPRLISFADYGITSLNSKSTYELLILGKNNKFSTPQMQKFIINYTPNDATIIIDGFKCDGNNGKFTSILPIGTHSYSISYKDYIKSGHITLFANVPKEISINLLENKFNTQSEHNIESQEQTIYNIALSLLKEGKDKDAEHMANQGIAKGFQICNKIIEALLIMGYYDDSPQKYKAIQYRLYQWKQKGKTTGLTKVTL